MSEYEVKTWKSGGGMYTKDSCHEKETITAKNLTEAKKKAKRIMKTHAANNVELVCENGDSYESLSIYPKGKYNWQ